MIPAIAVGPVAGPRVWVVARALYRARGVQWEICALASTRKSARQDLAQLRLTSYAHSRLVIFKLVRG